MWRARSTASGCARPICTTDRCRRSPWSRSRRRISRPARFWRGYDVLDTRDVGFIVSGPEAERAGTLFDTPCPATVTVDIAYGTDLLADSKRRLIEYLKTL